ncbi:MAG: transcription termination factor NusA [Verrucomicrobia bacterium]|nr:transcription termination factor NusA [Verrucomicrobiota bacterium]
MTSELQALFDYYEKEKGIDRETMIDAVSSALLSASKRSIGPARGLRIDINPEKGRIRALATLLVVEEVTKPFEELDLATARRVKPDAELGGEVEVEVTPRDFGRIAAQTAKQAMMQRLRQAEKAMIYDEFKDRAGDIVAGTVRRFERSDVIIDLGKFEAVMPSRERVQTEDYNVGDRIRAYVVEVENGARGPEIILSRSHPNFVRRLFESEVSEIADRTVEIRGIAREAGYRTKVAVHSGDSKVDPVGACVGLRGARVKNIVRELNNEKVDIIRWSDDPKEFLKDALKPATISDSKITIDEAEHRITVRVHEDELSKAIGRRGQNARLTSRLLGWDVKVERDESAHEQFEERVLVAAKNLAQRLEIDEELALGLVRGGMTTVDMVASVDASDIQDVVGVDEAEAKVILQKSIDLMGGAASDAAAAGAASSAASEPVASATTAGR